MGYIDDKEHFKNYIQRVIRETDYELNEDQLLPMQFYITHVYDKGLADAFTWDLKEGDAYLLEEKHLFDWLSENRGNQLTYCNFSHKLTDEFKSLSEDLTVATGCYTFKNHQGQVLYVGRSVQSLGSRIISSFDRFSSYDNSVYIQYVKTDSPIDACILEIYFISELSPSLNARENFPDEDLPLSVTPIPDWSEPILCNIVEDE